MTWEGEESRHVRLLKQIRFETCGQDVICPIGRCLRIVEWDAHGVSVEIEDGSGHYYFRTGDPRVTWATMDDLINEPEYNDYETHER